MKLSEQIESFLNLCETCESTYKFNYDIVGDCNKASTDFSHTLELEKLTYGERAKLATAERANLIVRRKAKDNVELYEPMVRWLTEVPEAKRAINMLKQILGEIRKVERYHENRVYRKRI